MTDHYAKPLMADNKEYTTFHFADRQHEQAKIWNHYKAARDGHIRVVLLVGEPGIGKTRLLDEIAMLAVDDGAIILRGSASDFEGMPPYLPFLEALGQYISVTPLDLLREQIGTTPQILASILPELVSRLGDLPAAYEIPPEQALLRLYEAIGTFLEAISVSNVLVLTLDDLHLADTASLDLLCYIAQHHSKAKILVLGACRADEIQRNAALDRVVIELAHLRVLTTIALSPLTALEIESLAVNYLGGPINQYVSQLLYTQSEGNPFFAEELLRGWIEEGTLVPGNAGWVATAPLEHALPYSIVGALRRRFNHLSSDIIDHLRIAAAIGRTFETSLLATVEGKDIEIVERSLLEAAKYGLLRAEPTSFFTFSHEKVRECLYAEVSISRRRRLHKLIGQILETRYGQESAKRPYQLTELAFHFVHSDDRTRGATYSQQAAERALLSFAFEEAMSHYRKALELYDSDDEERGNMLLGLGEAALLADEKREAATAFRAALTWFSQAGDVKAAARAAHGLGLALWRQGAFEASRTTLQHALSLLEDTDSALTVRVLVDLATLLIIYMKEQAKGNTYAQLAMEMAHRLEDRRLEATVIRKVIGKLNLLGNDISGAIVSMKQALALAKANDYPSEAAKCCLYLAGSYYFTCEITRSFEMSKRWIEFIEQSHQPYQSRSAYSWLALLYSSQGAWSDAEKAFEHAQLLVDNMSPCASSAFLHQVKGFLALQREDYLSAEQEFQVVLVDKRRDACGMMLHAYPLGLAQAELGKREDMLAFINKLKAMLAEQLTGTLPTATVITCLALLAIAVGDQELAVELYPQLLTFRGQHYWFLVDRVLGMLATLRRDWEMADIHLAEAVIIAQREGLRPELARTLQAQADLELAHGNQESSSHAFKLMSDALALFEELNMTKSVEQVRSQLLSLLRPKKGKATQPESLPANLTGREVKVLQLVAKGMSNRQIALELELSAKTVANHLTHIFNKTMCENRASAAAFALRNGLV